LIEGKIMAKRNEKKDLRNFGLFLTVLLSVLGGISFYRQSGAWPYFWGVAAFALITGLFIHPVMRPIFKGAMWVGEKINWFMTRVILSVFFIVFLSPIGLLMRLFRKDLVGRRFDPDAESYWKPYKRPEYDPEQSERLY